MLPRNKHILIVGGAGFIGSHLCERKLAEGCWVVCVDNLLTGRRENLAGMLDNERFTFIKHDVRESLPDFGHVDEIYNLACPASPRWYQTDPVGTMMTSVVGSRNLLELALHAGARIFLASTSEVYGNPECTPQAESYLGRVNPNGPRSCYDEGKRAAESLFCDYNRLFNVDTRIARIFNTYGPRMRYDDGRVIPTFLLQALSNEPITINGDGSQTRSFMYIDDLIEGITRLMRPNACSSPINLGNPEEISISDLASAIRRLTSSASPIIHQPLPEDDPCRRCPDIALAKLRLAWSPQISLDDGLRRMLERTD